MLTRSRVVQIVLAAALCLGALVLGSAFWILLTWAGDLQAFGSGLFQTPAAALRLIVFAEALILASGAAAIIWRQRDATRRLAFLAGGFWLVGLLNIAFIAHATVIPR